MKALLVLLAAVAVSLSFFGCSQEEAAAPEVPAPAAEAAVPVQIEDPAYPDGRYRGIFEDSGVQQVSIQFDLKDGEFTNLSYRYLFYGGEDYRRMDESHPYYPVVVQHQQLVEYLKGKPVEAKDDLYHSGEFIDDVDGFSGATLRGNKVLSAINDGLNRRLYSPAGEMPREIGTYPDGRYRGVYADSGYQQISIQFQLEDNTFTNVSYRWLHYGGEDYRRMNEGDQYYPVLVQHQQAAQYLTGKPLEAVFDLHDPGSFIDDVDGFSGATVRANKIFSAVRDGLNRGLYTPSGDVQHIPQTYPDGRYRGTFSDSGYQQVGVQFYVEDNHISNLTYRVLFYGGEDYRRMDESHQYYPVLLQHQQIAEYLEGKSLETLYDLFQPGSFIEDVDGFTGATIRANKVLSAVQDGLNRGLY